jgi:hypothetical protein
LAQSAVMAAMPIQGAAFSASLTARPSRVPVFDAVGPDTR